MHSFNPVIITVIVGRCPQESLNLIPRTRIPSGQRQQRALARRNAGSGNEIEKVLKCLCNRITMRAELLGQHEWAYRSCKIIANLGCLLDAIPVGTIFVRCTKATRMRTGTWTTEAPNNHLSGSPLIFLFLFLLFFLFFFFLL